MCSIYCKGVQSHYMEAISCDLLCKQLTLCRKFMGAACFFSPVFRLYKRAYLFHITRWQQREELQIYYFTFVELDKITNIKWVCYLIFFVQVRLICTTFPQIDLNVYLWIKDVHQNMKITWKIFQSFILFIGSGSPNLIWWEEVYMVPDCTVCHSDVRSYYTESTCRWFMRHHTSPVHITWDLDGAEIK